MKNRKLKIAILVAGLSVMTFTYANTQNQKGRHELKKIKSISSHQIKMHAKYVGKSSKKIEGAGGAVFDVSGMFLYDINKRGASLTPPTLHFERGEEYDVTLFNDMPNSLEDSIEVDMGRHKHTAYYRDTNLHLHGLIVSPCNPKDPATNDGKKCGKHYNGNYGDYVLVTLKPQLEQDAVKKPKMAEMPPVEYEKLTYHYEIPKYHPPGLSWYHPHIHGTSASQLGGGLAGLITIGKLWDNAYINCVLPEYAKRGLMGPVCKPGKLATKEQKKHAAVVEKTILLKDMQVKRESGDKNGKWLYEIKDPILDPNEPQDDPKKVTWCGDTPKEEGILGTCGQDSYTFKAGPNKGKTYDLKWLFTVNGMLAPQITVNAGKHDVWRIANMSANVTHDLVLHIGTDAENDATRIPMKLLSEDGIAIPNGGDFKVIRMMPAARVEVMVDAKAFDSVCENIKKNGKICGAVTLTSIGVETGKPPTVADIWPKNITLATVSFESSKAKDFSLQMVGKDSGDATALTAKKIANAPVALTAPALLGCTKNNRTTTSAQYRLLGLKNGTDTSGEFFKMGYGGECGGISDNQDWTSFTPQEIAPENYSSFNLMNALTIEADVNKIGSDGTKGYKEIWIIRNDSEELHNFHLHQTKFEIVYDSILKANPLGSPSKNHQLRTFVRAQARDKADMKAKIGFGKVDVYPVEPGQWIAIRVSFDHKEQLGTYVYHCHILEHEDKGMMSLINVIPPPIN
jgi:FtsP/CotA-like multicopper oxidase with cupredoxin domain